MRTTLFSLAALTTLSLVACASPATDESEGVTALHIEGSAVVDAIVIQQAERRFSRKLAADGTVLDMQIDEEVAVGSRTMIAKWASSETTAHCEETNIDGNIITTSIAMVDAESVFPLTTASAPDPNYVSETQRSNVTAYVGPYVFATNRDDSMICGGASPYFEMTATIYDLRTQQPVTLTIPDAVSGQAPAGAKLAELIPHFDSHGHLTVAYRFETDVAPAMSDHIGTKGTQSTTISGDLPTELQPYADPPASVMAYFAATGEPGENPGNPLLGWSQPY